MQCTLAFVVVIFLVGINVSEPIEVTTSPWDYSNSPDYNGPPFPYARRDPPKELAAENNGDTQSNQQLNQIQNNAAAVNNEVTQSNKQLKQIRINAAAVNPMNLISAVMSVNKRKLTESISSLKQLKQVLLENSDLATFIDNLVNVFENFSQPTIKSIIHTFPTYFDTLKKVGEELSGIAESPKEKLAIFNAAKFGKITSAERELKVAY